MYKRQSLSMRTWAGRLMAGLVAAAAIVASPFAQAEVIQMKAELTGTAEVPPSNSQGRGEADVQYDTVTHVLSWRVQYSGLTALLSAAHFHGTATRTTNAPILIPIAGVNQPTPLIGSTTLTDPQAADLLAGRWYINIHTPANPAGEIRGQVIRR